MKEQAVDIGVDQYHITVAIDMIPCIRGWRFVFAAFDVGQNIITKTETLL